VKTSGSRLRRLVWGDCKFVEINNSVIIICSYDLLVVKKSNYPSEPRPLVTDTRESNFNKI
jgi:hypothetical protein